MRIEISSLSGSEQGTVLQARQLRIGRRLAVMSGKHEPQPLVNALIQKDFHGTSRSSDSRQTKFLAFLQDLDGKLSTDRGEAFQKLIERFTVLDVVEQRLHGDASATEYGCSMHHFGIACDGFLHDSIVAQIPVLAIDPR